MDIPKQLLNRETVLFQITYKELREMDTQALYIPASVQLRLKLNEAGFKFHDDGTPGVMTNQYPIPLGNLEIWSDDAKKIRYFRQTL